MKEAVGSSEGRAGDASVTEELEATQDFDFNSVRMRRRIISSGTKEPARIWDWASRPAIDVSSSYLKFLKTDHMEIL